MMVGFGGNPGNGAITRARIPSARTDEHILAWYGYPCREIRRRGIYATVHNYAEWQTLADPAAAAYRAGKEGQLWLLGIRLALMR